MTGRAPAARASRDLAKILLVDDRPENLVALEAILEPLQRPLVRASSGREALRYLLDQEFAVILLDVQMPELDGFETAEIIKSREKTRHVPLIFLTALSKERDYVFRGYQSGAVDYLTKPFEPEILVSKVRVFIELYEQERRLHAQETELREAEARARARELSQARREAALKMREARVLAALSEGVLLLDEDGVIHLWNPAAAYIFRVSEEDALGRPISEVLPAWDEVAGRIPISDSAKVDAVATIVPLEVAGRERWLSFTAVRAQDGVIYALRDNTAARALENMKSDFITTVSHELKTPLTSVVGAAQTLARTDISRESRDQLFEVITQESARLTQIVNDILVAGRIDSGLDDPHTERTDVGAAVRETVAAARTRLPENLEVEIKADGDGSVPPAQVDPSHLRQILANLLENAIKYSPDGGRITFELAATPSAVRIGVRDQGLGIPAGEEQRIFEKFYRLDAQMTRGIGGTGLGLYICRELVERSSGRMWLEHQPDGSLFVVEVPVAA